MDKESDLFFSQIEKVELTPEGVERLAHLALLEGIKAAIQVVESVDVEGDPTLEGLKSHIVERLRTAEVVSVSSPHVPKEG